MIVDYHTHSRLCKHGEGHVEDFILKAIELGIGEIGCAEHSPMPNNFDIKHRMTLDEFDSIYTPKVKELQKAYAGKITVRRGIEADFFPGTEEWIKEFVEKNEFDFVIGSVHFIGEWGFDDPIFVHQYDERDVAETYEQYFDAVKKSVSSGLFDIIGHLDLVKKFGYRPKKDFEIAIRDTLGLIKERDLCIEVNTSGLRKPVKEIYPSEKILSMAQELGIPLTLGSDAHKPEEVGAEFELGKNLIQKYGKGKIAVFEKRKRRLIEI